MGQAHDEALLAVLLKGRAHAALELDAAGAVVARSGDLGAFPGAEERAADLPRPEPGEHIALPRIELSEGRSTEVHCLGRESGSLVLLIDATALAERELHFQQRGNELRRVLAAWGIAVFEETPSGLCSRSAPPAWLRALTPWGSAPEAFVTASPFLENFLVDAQVAWAGGQPGYVRSGLWTETDEHGGEWHLEASAGLTEDGRRMLLVESMPGDHRRRQELLQAARSRDGELALLRKEIDKKEVLLHCIVHDLLAPLGSMVGSMSLVRGSKLPAERAEEMLALGLAQAERQATLIRGILDAFASEVEDLERFEADPEHAPRIRTALEEALANCRAAYEARGVRAELALELVDPEKPEPVAADAARLERVLSNLLENALRHSPRGTLVTLRLSQPGPGLFEVAIEDQGPGVPEAEVATLFTRFAQGTSGGAAGLGLYFCKRTLAAWGGELGYRPGARGGAVFWFRLKGAAQAPASGVAR